MKRNSRIIRLIAISIANAILLLLVCYFADNWRFSILTGPSVGQRIEELRMIYELTKESPSSRYFSVPDEYVFINVAYDRELVPVDDAYGLPIGNIDIADRKKLTEFISGLKDRHKYVLIDVLLSKYHSASDSALVSAIANTKRIGVARSATAELIDSALLAKAGFTDYSTHLYETNFVKYEFMTDSGPSLPYLAFIELTPKDTVASAGPFHFRNGHLAWKSLSLKFPIKATLFTRTAERHNLKDTRMEESVILNLGSEVLEGMDIPSLVEGKIVVIGDFTEDDIHDTYLGKIAGPVINANALEALRNNDLEIPWWLIIALFIVYSVIAFTIMMPESYNYFISISLRRLRPKSKFMRYLLSFVGYTVIFTIFAIIIYLSSGIDINILIPSLWFTVLSGITRYRRGMMDKYKLPF